MIEIKVGAARIGHAYPASGETKAFDLTMGERAVPDNVAYGVVTLTANEVSEIAAEVKRLPEHFEPVSWLEENFESIAAVATAAVRDIVIEALEIGLADHPLVLLNRRAATLKTLH